MVLTAMRIFLPSAFARSDAITDDFPQPVGASIMRTLFCETASAAFSSISC